MGVSVRILQQAVNTSTGTQDFTVSGWGQTPKAALLYLTHCTANNTITAGAVIGVGACDGTRQWAITARSQDNLTTTSSNRRGATDESIMLYQHTSSTIDFEANFDSFISNGIRLNIGVASSAFLLTIVLFAGSDVSVYADADNLTNAQDVAQSFNASGFQPDLLWMSSQSTNFGDTNAASYSLSYGVASRTSPIRQCCQVSFSTDGSSTTDCSMVLYNNRIIASISGSSVSRTGEITAFNTTGFDLTKRDGTFNINIGYLAVRFGGITNFDLRHYTSPTSTGSLSRTVFGWKPQFVQLFPSFSNAVNTVRQTPSDGASVWSASLIDTVNRYSLSNGIEDEASTSRTNALVSNTALRTLSNIADDTIFEGTLTSLDATGYTLNVTKTNGTGRNWVEIGIEEDAGAPPVEFPPNSLALTGAGR